MSYRKWPMLMTKHGHAWGPEWWTRLKTYRYSDREFEWLLKHVMKTHNLHFKRDRLRRKVNA